MQFNEDISPPKGEVSVRPLDREGKILSDPWKIFKNPKEIKNRHTEKEFDSTGYIPLDHNLVVNSGRQIIAYLIGGKDYSDSTPINDWIITKVSWGLGAEVPRFTDTSISPQPSATSIGGANELAYDGVNYKKAIAGVDWPSPFIVRFESILGADEGNGYLIRELGLWTANETLFARKVFPAVAKNDTVSLSFLHSVRV